MAVEPIREVPQRELRNNVGQILREVASGTRLRITVRGKPVADLIPIEHRPSAVPWSVIERIVDEAPLDAKFADDVHDLFGQTIEEM